MGRRVLITGVSGFWGTELARRLERDPEFEYIAGLDVRPPAADLERTEFIRADIRNPLLSKLLPQTEVDTVVHCDVLLVPEPGKAPSQLHDINVIGSLQLLAACEKTDSVRTIVVRGSAAIYGAEPNAPSSSPRTWRAASLCALGSSATSGSSRTTSRTSPAASRR